MAKGPKRAVYKSSITNAQVFKGRSACLVTEEKRPFSPIRLATTYGLSTWLLGMECSVCGRVCRQPYKRVLCVPGTPFLGTCPHEVLLVVGRYLSPETFIAVFVITNSFKHVECPTVNIGSVNYGAAIWWLSVK